MTKGGDRSGIVYPRTFMRGGKSVTKAVDRLLEELRLDATRGLHLGGGNSRLAGMINCDLFNPKADMKTDAKDLSRFDDGTIDLIESHHMIEHLSFADVDIALTEWNRVLRLGGRLVLSCPDITRISLKWLKYYILYPVYPRPDKLDYILKMIAGSQENAGMFHQSVYSLRGMRKLLSKYGFTTEFIYAPYSRRPTPSLIAIARKSR